MSRCLLLLLLVISLSACAKADHAADRNAERDPAVAAALNDPIMADPDLASQNRGNSALTGGGPANGDLPAFNRSPEEADAARTAAEAALGGPIAAAPAAGETAKVPRLAGMLTAQAIAAAAKVAPPGCADKTEYTLVWAARLPAGLEIYPRGHAVMAGGTDLAGCKLRAVRFVTPVSVADVVNFYFASAVKAKLPAGHRREGDDEVVSGRQGAFSYAVFARQRADGLTEVDLVTSGF